MTNDQQTFERCSFSNSAGNNPWYWFSINGAMCLGGWDADSTCEFDPVSLKCQRRGLRPNLCNLAVSAGENCYSIMLYKNNCDCPNCNRQRASEKLAFFDGYVQ